MNRRPSKSRRSYDSFAPHRSFKASSPDTDFFEAKTQRSAGRVIVKGFLLALVLALAVNSIANRFVFVRRVEVPVTRLTEAFDGYTILHISDLKGASFGKGQSSVISAVSSADYDVVVLTGDMVSPMGNAQPLYELIEALKELHPDVPVYFIAGDNDPDPLSMEYASSGSAYAPWVLGAQQRGAQLLSAPQQVEHDEQTLWLSTTAQLTLDLDTMQQQYELAYLRAQESGDEIEIELARHNLLSLQSTSEARRAMTEDDVFITLTHVPPLEEDLTNAADSLVSQVDLILCGHYLGGLVRLPLIGPVFIPSQNLPLYGLFPGAKAYCGLSRISRTWVYASSGLGGSDEHYPALFARFCNPPSVSLLTLTPSAL